MESKRKSEQAHVLGGSGKTPKVYNSRSMGQKDRIRCGKCVSMHEGQCRVGSLGCFKCGPTAHFGRDGTAATTNP